VYATVSSGPRVAGTFQWLQAYNLINRLARCRQTSPSNTGLRPGCYRRQGYPRIVAGEGLGLGAAQAGFLATALYPLVAFGLPPRRALLFPGLPYPGDEHIDQLWVIVAGLAQPVAPRHLFESPGRLRPGQLAPSDLVDGPQG
jgi:hypothetical protein